jgi:hypothetical protein
MIVKEIRDEDFTSYKKPSMVIGFPSCSFKCCKEGNFPIETCQNCSLARANDIEISVGQIVERYLSNRITSAIICAGLEPLDSWRDLMQLISLLRSRSNDDIVIYTGYTKEEIPNQLQYLRAYRNIIVKFGRFIPNQQPHYDEILGVKLASDNQYAEVIS